MLLVRGKTLTLSPTQLQQLGLGEVFIVSLDSSIALAKAIAAGDEA